MNGRNDRKNSINDINICEPHYGQNDKVLENDSKENNNVEFVKTEN